MEKPDLAPPKKSKKKIIAVILIGVVILAGVVFLVLSQIPDKAKVQRAEELVEEALELVEDYEFAAAMEKYAQAKDEYDGNVDIYTGIANIYLMKNRVDDAVETLEIAAKKARTPSKAYQLLGEIYIDEGDFELAIPYLRTAVKQDKTNNKAIYSLALAYINDYNFDDAMDVLDIPEDAGDTYVKSQIMKAVLSGDDLAEVHSAIDSIDVSEVEEESLVDIVEAYNDVLSLLDKLDDAEKTDKYVDVLLAKGALDAGYEDVVINLLEDYADEEDEYWELNLYLGHAYYINGDIDSAIDCLVSARSLNPTDAHAPWLLGRVYHDSGDESKMIDSYESAIEAALTEEKAEIRNEFAQLLLILGQYALAEEQYSVLGIENEASSSEYALLMAEAMINGERFDRAEEVLDNLDESVLPEHLLMKYYWLKSKIDFENGNRDEAMELIENAIEIDSSVADYYLVLGELFFENGDDDAAKEALEKCIDLDLEGNVSASAGLILDRL